MDWGELLPTRMWYVKRGAQAAVAGVALWLLLWLAGQLWGAPAPLPRDRPPPATLSDMLKVCCVRWNKTLYPIVFDKEGTYVCEHRGDTWWKQWQGTWSITDHQVTLREVEYTLGGNGWRHTGNYTAILILRRRGNTLVGKGWGKPVEFLPYYPRQMLVRPNED